MIHSKLKLNAQESTSTLCKQTSRPPQHHIFCSTKYDVKVSSTLIFKIVLTKIFLLPTPFGSARDRSSGLGTYRFCCNSPLVSFSKSYSSAVVYAATFQY